MKFNDLTLTVFLVFFMIVVSVLGGQMGFDINSPLSWEGEDGEEFDIMHGDDLGDLVIDLDEGMEQVGGVNFSEVFGDTVEFWVAMNIFGIEGAPFLTPVWWFLEALAVILLARGIRGVSS